jgi:hypothetical protein
MLPLSCFHHTPSSIANCPAHGKDKTTNEKAPAPQLSVKIRAPALKLLWERQGCVLAPLGDVLEDSAD